MAKQALREALAPVKYQASDGSEVVLTLDEIKEFLVQGKSELVTDKEFKYFMSVCQAKRMNPFVHDCFLVKYSKDDNAAIIVSIHFKRRRARKNDDCQGWQKGIIVLRDGKVEKTHGLFLKDDELLGGWFKAKPRGWDEAFELEIPLDAYIKKKRDGNITAFWQKAKQPMMIAKVAESQGLEAVWPEEGGPLYTDAEIQPGQTALPEPEEEGEPDPEKLKERAEEFDKKVGAEFQDMAKSDEEHLDKFLDYAVASGRYGETAEHVKDCALDNWDDFVKAWQDWEPEEKLA